MRQKKKKVISGISNDTHNVVQLPSSFIGETRRPRNVEFSWG